MFFKIWINYLLGYVNIKVESFYLERFINICISKKIFLWNIKREKASILYANISIKDYKKIRNIAKKTKSIIKIENKRGLPFIVHKYRKRKMFLVLLLSVIIGLIITSNYIWNIDVNGNDTISKEEIINELKNDGLKIGANKKSLNINSILNQIRLNRDDIAWVGIDIKGTNAIVEIKEAQKAPEIINENEYCNIVSNKSGIITKINVQNGTADVKEGDIVKPGDTLVSGYMEGKYTGTRYVHSVANIEAKVWHTKKEKFYFQDQKKVPTSATEKKYSIKFNNFRINFYKTLSKFQNYDTINTEKNLLLFSNFYLPIKIIKTTNYEYENIDVKYTEEELKSIAIKKLEEELKEEIEKEEKIINKQVNVYGNNEYLEVEVIYEVLEDIGTQEKILF